MRLAPDVAGVTLFAFASGAPDLFTQIAAVAVGGTVDQELAISATLGGGLFIIAAIMSCVMLVAKGKPPEEGGGPEEITVGGAGPSSSCWVLVLMLGWRCWLLSLLPAVACRLLLLALLAGASCISGGCCMWCSALGRAWPTKRASPCSALQPSAVDEGWRCWHAFASSRLA